MASPGSPPGVGFAPLPSTSLGTKRGDPTPCPGGVFIAEQSSVVSRAGMSPPSRNAHSFCSR